MKVMVGGTFDPLHDGHRFLISRAFEAAGPDGEVTIGLTSEAFADRKSHPIHPYHEREAGLFSFIREKKFSSQWNIEELHDQFGSSLDADFDALIVSEETFPVLSRFSVQGERLICEYCDTVIGSDIPSHII